MKKALAVSLIWALVLAAASSASAEGNDTNTVFLIQSDSIDGDLTFVDSSPGGDFHLVTGYGDIHHSTGDAKLGGSSLYFDGSGDFLSVDHSDDFVFGTGDFTIDFWMKPTSMGFRACVASLAVTSPTDSTGWNIHIMRNGAMHFAAGSTGMAFGALPNKTDFHHIAITREGNTLRGFINGTLTAAVSAVGIDIHTPAPVVLGKYGPLPTSSSDASWFGGYLDHFRMSKGVARWTESFTPPTGSPDRSEVFPVTPCDVSLMASSDWVIQKKKG